MTDSSGNDRLLLYWGAPAALCVAAAAVITAFGLNIPLFLWVQREAGSSSARLWQNITLFGNGLVAVALCTVWLRHRPNAVWAALLGAIPTILITRFFKMTMHVPRPIAVLHEQVHVLGPAYQQTSFPSGDAMTAFLVAGVACSLYRSAAARTLIVAGASLIALSRLVIGVHWPTDVLCGAAAGWVCAYAGLQGAQRWPIAQSPRARLWLTLFTLSSCIILCFSTLRLPLANTMRFAEAITGSFLCVTALVDLAKGLSLGERLKHSFDLSMWLPTGAVMIPAGLQLSEASALQTGGNPTPPSFIKRHAFVPPAWRTLIFTRDVGVVSFIVTVSLVNVALFHWPLYRTAFSQLSALDRHSVLPVLTLLVVQLVVTFTLLGLAALFSIRLLKLLCIVFAIGNAVAFYFIVQYGVIIDATMSGNVLGTHFAEASELAHPKMLLYVVFLGLLPAMIIARVRIVEYSRVKTGGLVLLTFLLGIGWLYGNAQTWLWIDKNAKQFGGLMLPWSYVVNPLRYYHREAALNIKPTLLPPLSTTVQQRVVVVVVIGESARAQNFSLYGYSLNTNPLLAQAGVIAFPHARSCATYTTEALRCMLSYRGERFANDEPLPSYLYRNGVEVIWRTNNFGEPPMNVSSFERIEQMRKLCAGTCGRVDFDEGLLEGLAAKLRDAPNGRKTLVVLHQAGSHGPQYFRKYPPEFERFKPACHTVELQKCSAEELVNAYDNTILYTDYFLDHVIQILRSLKGTASAMLYISDHGESLGERGVYLHGLPLSIAPDVQTSVPLLVWMSDEFERSRGLSHARLSAPSYLSDDVVFHSTMGALGVTSSVYAPEYDLFRSMRLTALLPMSPQVNPGAVKVTGSDTLH